MHVKWKIMSALVLIGAVAAISACAFCNITGRDAGIVEFVQKADFEKLKKEAGIK